MARVRRSRVSFTVKKSAGGGGATQVRGSAVLTFAVTGDFVSHTMTVTGANVGDEAIMAMANVAGVNTAMWNPPLVTAANTVTITAFDALGGGINITGTFNVTVFKR